LAGSLFRYIGDTFFCANRYGSDKWPKLNTAALEPLRQELDQFGIERFIMLFVDSLVIEISNYHKYFQNSYFNCGFSGVYKKGDNYTVEPQYLKKCDGEILMCVSEDDVGK
jgi:hypothetical protein